MKKFFTKKGIIAAVVIATITIFIGVFIGNIVTNNIQTKEKLAKEVSSQNTYEKRKKQIEDKKNAQTEEEKEEQIIETIKEESYTEEFKKYIQLSDEEKEKLEVVPREQEIDFTELDKIKDDQEKDLEKDEEELVEAIPEQFDLRDKINIQVENQETFGLCWNFATLKSIETNLALTQNKYYDLSESHVDYMTSSLLSKNSRKENTGGNFRDVIKYNNDFKGFVLEEEIPLNVYEDYEYNTFYNTPKEQLCITKYVNFPRLNNYNKEDYDSIEEYETKKLELQNTVKTHIMNYGSVYASIRVPILLNKNHYMEPGIDMEYKGRGHAVSIVGWDDNYSRENFKSPSGAVPEKDGAYIVLNSWGEAWGDNGYFYISYEDESIHQELSGIISINKTSDLIKLDEYKPQIREFLTTNYYGMIFDIDGTGYISMGAFDNQSIDLSNLEISSVDEVKGIIEHCNSINLSNNNLTNIDGIENYITKGRAIALKLANNKIKDVTPLKDLNLALVDLEGNYGVTGYGSLNVNAIISLKACGITNFENADVVRKVFSLNLSDNNIENFDFLNNCEKLSSLNLSNCGLQNLEPIQNLKIIEELSELNISNNNLTDISSIENWNVQDVNLSYNTEISSFEPLRKNKSIETIILNNCNIKDAGEVVLGINTDAFDYCIIEYDLSDNPGIYNLKALTNATGLELRNCNLGDISELRKLEHLDYLDVSDNPGVYGDLSGKVLTFMYVNNCDLDDSFDCFNSDGIYELCVYGNNINDFSKLGQIARHIYIYEIRNEEMVIDIPCNEGVSVNITQFMKQIIGESYSMYSVEIDGKKYKADYGIIPVTEKTRIVLKKYDYDKYICTLRINDNLTENGIMVTKLNHPYIDTTMRIDSSMMEVSALYDYGIMRNIEDFDISNEVGFQPSKYVEREYYIGEKIYIFVAEKHYSYVSYKSFEAKFALRNAAAEVLDEDLIIPDGFEEEFPDVELDEDLIVPEGFEKEF